MAVKSTLIFTNVYVMTRDGPANATTVYMLHLYEDLSELTKQEDPALGLSQLREADSTEWHWMMAISIIMMLPCIAVFFSFQRYFVQGITMTSSKGEGPYATSG